MQMLESFQVFLESIFREMLLQGVGGKVFVVPPKISVVHNPKRLWR